MTFSRSILLVTAHYPPSTESGARRPYELVGALTAAGIPVEVLATGDSDGSASESDRGNSIHRVRRQGHADRSIRKTEVVHGSDAPRPGLLRRVGELLPGVRRQYLTWRHFRDESRNLYRPLAARGVQCHPALVYSTAPPMAAHRAARLIARHHGVPWIAEFRDHWADPGTGRNAFADTIFAPLAAHIRRQTVQQPDLTIAVSEGIARWLQLHGARETVVARNGVPDRLLEPFADPAIHFGQIAYFGEFYFSRTPEPLFRALATLAATESSGAFRLEFTGEVERVGTQMTASLLQDSGLAACTTMRGRRPHAEVMTAMREAGLLLLLAQKQPDQIPNKLYEYIAARRPILAWVDDEGESARMLRAIGGHFLVTEHASDAEVLGTVKRALEASRAHWAPESTAAIDDLRTSRQLERVVASVADFLQQPQS